jgi:Disulfide bond formation protein DsbB
MVQALANTLPLLTLIAHGVFLIVFVSILFRNSWGRYVTNWIGKNSTALVFVVSLFALVGSLFYSNFVGFSPCELCWWQRVFLYPIPLITGIALLKKESTSFGYSVPLALVAGIIALYHSYVNLGGASILPCTAVGGECSRLYVMAFGYITIPMMSLTVALYILLIAWAKNIYDKNSNA